MTTQQQPTSKQPESKGLAYQILLLSLEAMHFRDTGHGAQHLVNAAFRVMDQAAALTAAREALEWTLEQAEDWRGSLTGSDLLEEYDEKLTVARAALAALKGGQP